MFPAADGPNVRDRSADPDGAVSPVEAGDAQAASRVDAQVEDEAQLKMGFWSIFWVQTAILAGGLGLGVLFGLTGDRISSAGVPLWSGSWSGAGWSIAILSGVTMAWLMLGTVWQLHKMEWAWLLEIEEILQRVLVPSLRRCSAVQLALIAILAGVGEELCFRWALQGGVELVTRKLGSVLRGEYGFTVLERPGLMEATAFFVAAGTVSIAFGAFHAVTRAYFWIASLMGFGFAMLAGFGGGLIGAMLAHGLYDFLAFLWICQRWPFGGEKRVADSP